MTTFQSEPAPSGRYWFICRQQCWFQNGRKLMTKRSLIGALCGIVYFALAAVASEAADYEINRSLWEAMSTEEQEALVSILRKSGSIEAGDTISGSDQVEIETFGEVGTLDDFKINGWQDNACMIACGATLAARVGLCSTMPPGLWPACTGVAYQGYNICMGYCTQ